MSQPLVGGPYEAFAGHDASRGLATMQTGLVSHIALLLSLFPTMLWSKVSDKYDDLQDLKDNERDTLLEWYSKFQSKYPIRWVYGFQSGRQRVSWQPLRGRLVN